MPAFNENCVRIVLNVLLLLLSFVFAGALVRCVPPEIIRSFVLRRTFYKLHGMWKTMTESSCRHQQKNECQCRKLVHFYGTQNYATF